MDTDVVGLLMSVIAGEVEALTVSPPSEHLAKPARPAAMPAAPTVFMKSLREHPDARLLLTVHDELVLEVPESDLGAVAGLVQSVMEGVETLAVPLVVDLAHGPTWYDAKP